MGQWLCGWTKWPGGGCVDGRARSCADGRTDCRGQTGQGLCERTDWVVDVWTDWVVDVWTDGPVVVRTNALGVGYVDGV